MVVALFGPSFLLGGPGGWKRWGVWGETRGKSWSFCARREKRRPWASVLLFNIEVSSRVEGNRGLSFDARAGDLFSLLLFSFEENLKKKKDQLLRAEKNFEPELDFRRKFYHLYSR